ncbi:DUF4386 domain-containing protein [Nonomuraea sp. NPDC050404]|uniref:DUF4386 domain-containing protein n=1 Tax=Nonomuraea sp. NPDC050404 TaxID=3155783 RepID=UPI0033CF2726
MLIIVGMIAGLLSVVPVLEDPRHLDLIAAHEGQILTGAAAQFVMIPAYLGFALCLYPALRRANEALSLGFVGFRLIAATFHFVGVILLPLFLVPGQEPAVGELLRTARDLVNHVALIIALSLGDLLLFAVLYRSRYIPRWLSVWGLLGAAFAMSASFLVLFGLTEVVTPLYLGMNVPPALHGLVLAVWLLVKGFDERRVAGAAGLTAPGHAGHYAA